jgi:hypothetical protein
MVCFEVLSQNFPAETHEFHKRLKTIKISLRITGNVTKVQQIGYCNWQIQVCKVTVTVLCLNK